MGAREKILAAIKANQPTLTAAPDSTIDWMVQYANNTTQFIQVLQGIGGEIMQVSPSNTLEQILTQLTHNKVFVINTVQLTELEKEQVNNYAVADLALLDMAIIQGTLGVAENGAIWVSESAMGSRVLPFICEHLVILVNSATIVSNLAIAYQQINAFKEGFGVFIAGPSKTADIEQSLVIGAHGPKKCTVILN